MFFRLSLPTFNCHDWHDLEPRVRRGKPEKPEIWISCFFSPIDLGLGCCTLQHRSNMLLLIVLHVDHHVDSSLSLSSLSLTGFNYWNQSHSSVIHRNRVWYLSTCSYCCCSGTAEFRFRNFLSLSLFVSLLLLVSHSSLPSLTLLFFTSPTDQHRQAAKRSEKSVLYYQRMLYLHPPSGWKTHSLTLHSLSNTQFTHSLTLNSLTL